MFYQSHQYYQTKYDIKSDFRQQICQLNKKSKIYPIIQNQQRQANCNQRCVNFQSNSNILRNQLHYETCYADSKYQNELKLFINFDFQNKQQKIKQTTLLQNRQTFSVFY
ncbi:hypothetical protein ABPG72_004959 [Tetrahymena utriculariae]